MDINNNIKKTTFKITVTKSLKHLTTYLVPRDRNASRKHNRFYIENAQPLSVFIDPAI